MLIVTICVVVALIAIGARHIFASFWAQPLDAYREGDAFDLRRDLDGSFTCDGVIYGPMGRVVSRFHAVMRVTWDDTGQGRLDETFTYETGSTQDRTWTLSVAQDGTISGNASDFVGPLSGRQSGDAVGLRYRIKLPDDAGGHVLTVRDWMYKTPKGTIINRSEMRKFGIKVAELNAVIQAASDA